jgi:hypothetical protein
MYDGRIGVDGKIEHNNREGKLRGEVVGGMKPQKAWFHMRKIGCREC